MKTLGLCILLVSCMLGASVSAQDQFQTSQNAADDAIVQLWQAHAGQTDGAKIEGDKLIMSSDEDSKTCLYLRVYRVRRRATNSDVTVPSGYTTCVSVNRFEKKSAEMPKLQLIPQR